MTAHNAHTMKQARKIQVEKSVLLFERKSPIKDKNQPSFMRYFYQKACRNDFRWLIVYKHFDQFLKEKAWDSETITAKICEEFKDYLANVPKLKGPKGKLNIETSRKYNFIFSRVVKDALNEKIIDVRHF